MAKQETEAKKDVKMYSGEVISPFTVRGGTKGNIKTKEYKVADPFETEHKKVFDHLANQHKIK